MTSAQANLNQAIQTGLFEELQPVVVLGPVVEMSFDEKVLRAVDAIKQQVRAGRHLLVAWSAGKDSSCVLNLAFTALIELKAEGVDIPMLHVIHSNTIIEPAR